MKILDIPQSGKRGLYVSQGGRYGQISRILVIPANPRTAPQMSVRAILTRVTARWRSLQETQRAAWRGAALAIKSVSRLGQNGPLTGAQLFSKINCTLAQFGQDQVDAPPPRPLFSDLAPQNLVITNVADAITLKLTCPTNPGQNTIVRGSAPVSQGIDKLTDFRILGTCPVPAGGAADITSLYTTRYGVPPVGTKVFVRVSQYVAGWEDQPLTFAAIVPTSA
jgi:hypothetical protein